MNKRMIIKIAGFVLCALFFAAPLAQCSRDSSITATGLEIAAGTGKLMGQADKSYPVVFLLLAIPVILVLVAFANQSFTALRNVSIGGLAAHIIFMITAYAMLNSGKGENAMLNGTFELTIFNWLILGIYIGLICFTHYYIKQEKESNITSSVSSSSNLANISPLLPNNPHKEKKPIEVEQANYIVIRKTGLYSVCL